MIGSVLAVRDTSARLSKMNAVGFSNFIRWGLLLQVALRHLAPLQRGGAQRPRYLAKEKRFERKLMVRGSDQAKA